MKRFVVDYLKMLAGFAMFIIGVGSLVLMMVGIATFDVLAFVAGFLVAPIAVFACIKMLIRWIQF